MERLSTTRGGHAHAHEHHHPTKQLPLHLSLALTQSLVERSKELNLLREAYQRTIDEETSEFVTISANAGNGKSTLVQAFRKIHCPNALYCRGKFDLSRKREPFSALKDAFEALCRELIREATDDDGDDGDNKDNGDNTDANTLDVHKATIRKDCQAALGTECKTLTHMLPSLSPLIGAQPHDCYHQVGDFSSSCTVSMTAAASAMPTIVDTTTTSSSNGLSSPSSSSSSSSAQMALHRLHFLFRSLVRSITRTKPLVLFFDDLQWVDASSIHILARLLTDSKAQRFLVVGAYRPDELGDYVRQNLNKIERDRSKPTVHIALHNLSPMGVHQLICEKLQIIGPTTESRAKEFAQLLHAQSGGNVFFVLQLLRALQENALLWYDRGQYRWQTSAAMRASETFRRGNNVVELLVGRIQRQQPDLQKCLQLSSCLASNVDVACLSSLLQGTSLLGESDQPLAADELLYLLQTGTKEGFWVRVDSGHHRFAHDRIRQAAYGMMEQGYRERLHKQIGTVFLDMSRVETNPHRQHWMRFVAAEQMDRALSCFQLDQDKLSLARLNLETAQGAAAKFAFVPASQYLKAGIQVMDSVANSWQKHYDLQLGLHQTLAHVSLSIGNPIECIEIVDIILKHVRSTQDKIEAYIALVKALGAQEKVVEAVRVEIKALHELHMYPLIPQWTTRRLLFSVKRKLRKMSLKDVESIPECENPVVICAMKILQLMTRHATYKGDNLHWLMSVALNVRLALKYGIHKSSIPAFGELGILVANSNAHEGHRLGCMSANFVKRLGLVDTLTSNILHIWVNPWFDTLTATLDPLLESFQMGMVSGEVELASTSFNGYLMHYYMSGLSLGPLLEDAQEHHEMLEEYDLSIPLGFVKCLRDAVAGLVRGPSPLEQLRRSKDADDDDLLFVSEHTGNEVTLGVYYQWRMEVCFYFGEFARADRMRRIEKTKYHSGKNHISFYRVATMMYFDALIPLTRILWMLYCASASDTTTTTTTMTKRRKRHTKTLMVAMLHRARRALRVMKRAVDKEHKGINLKPKLVLVEAVLVATEGALRNGGNDESDDEFVRRRLDYAIAMLSRSGLRQDAAAANLLASIAQHRNEYWSQKYMLDAIATFRDWGALAVADYWEHRFTALLSQEVCEMEQSSNLKGRQRLGRFRLQRAKGDSMQTFLQTQKFEYFEEE